MANPRILIKVFSGWFYGLSNCPDENDKFWKIDFTSKGFSNKSDQVLTLSYPGF